MQKKRNLNTKDFVEWMNKKVQRNVPSEKNGKPVCVAECDRSIFDKCINNDCKEM